jgi:phosphoribosylformylglycinamidine synthase subunit PurS
MVEASTLSLFQAHVTITLKPGVLDPQGKAIEGALARLGFTCVQGVSVGKRISFTLSAPSQHSAQQEVAVMAEQLLANTVIEQFSLEVTPLERPA